MVHGLRGALSGLLDEYETIDYRDRIYVSLWSVGLGNALDRWGLTAGEWQRNGDCAGVILDNMPKMLNSKEQFYVRVTPKPKLRHTPDSLTDPWKMSAFWSRKNVLDC